MCNYNMHAELNACMRQRLGACMRMLGAEAAGCIYADVWDLVHAQESGACTKRKRPRAGPTALFLRPRHGPWPLQCMHKSVVHAQECCACTRILCMHKNLGPKNKPLLLGRCAASGFLFSGKKASNKNNNAYL